MPRRSSALAATLCFKLQEQRDALRREMSHLRSDGAATLCFKRLNALQTAKLSELKEILFVNNISCLYPTYIRGQAYLTSRQGTAATAEFQNILDHSGIVWNCWTGALAHLGVARANALQSRSSQGADADAARVRARVAYRDFLTLWKDAELDIPILIEAKRKYAKLQ